ncbi:hypothetical protein Taro_041666 [Colocasia esculenta]|uniref:Uncharacterized protein n=1 Tax=Colocasia esculenta TaxID=4460 RepID=A0A843WMB8_COLES|nr:hypothetical protein [Colocasia esculenta]
MLLTWLLGVSRGDTWLFLPNLVEVRDVGACVVRLWSQVVAPVFRELLCLGGCVLKISFASTLLEFLLLWLGLAVSGVRCRTVVVAACSPCVASSVSCERECSLYCELRVAFLQVLVLFEFIAYLSGLNSNPSGSSDPWVAARPSRVPGWGPGGRVVIVSPSVSCRRVLLLLLGAHAASVVAVFARAAVGFVLGLRICVGVSRSLREPACGVAIISARLLPVDPGVSLLDVCLALCTCAPLDAVLCSVGIFARAKQMLVCRVAPLVERCDTYLWLLPTLCWLVVDSDEVIPEFFSVGSGGGEVFFPQNCVVLISGCCGIALWVEVHRWAAWVLVLFPRTVGCCPGEGCSQDCSGLVSVGCCATSGLMYAAVVLAGAFWWVFPERRLGGFGGGSPRTSCVASAVCCVPSVGRLFGLRFGDGSQNGSWHFGWRSSLSYLLRWWDFVCPQGREVGFVSRTLWALPDGSLSARLLLVEVVDLDPVCGQFAVLFSSKFLGCAGGTTCGSM